MRNLKKILSLALALVMVMSLLTVASAREFNDAADIEHTEAVEVMSSLGVINGMGNNTFNPKGNVTRAEMAKMITYISLGNVEASAFLGTEANLTDINGHWAEAFIKYCYSQGIISGRGNGIFDPNASVTAAEAARMLLVTIGYDADVQVYTGSQWKINVIRDAQLSHFFDDVAVTADKVLTRDEASQMMYNALTNPSVRKTAERSVSTGEVIWTYNPDDKPLLEKSFDAQVFIGRFEGNKDTGKGSVAGEIQVQGNLEANYDGPDAKPAVSGGAGYSVIAANFPYDYDIANIGEEVKVIFKDGTSGRKNQPDKQDTIFGVYKTGTTTVYNITKDGIQECKKTDSGSSYYIRFGGTDYELAGTVTVMTNYAGSTRYTGAGSSAGQLGALKTLFNTTWRTQSADTIKVVLDDTGKVNAIYMVEVELGKVTSITSDKVTISGVGAIKLDENNIYANPAKDDVVVYSSYYAGSSLDDKYFTVQLAEVISGEVTAYDATAGSGNQNKVSIDGTSYKIHEKTLKPSLTDDYFTDLTTSDSIGKKVNVYMVGGMVGAIQEVESSDSHYALVTSTNSQNTSGVNEGKVQLLQSDGTKTTYVVDEDSKGQANSIPGANKVYVAPNTLVRFNVKSNGRVNITNVYSDSTTAQVWNNDTKRVAGVGVASSDCVLYVYTGSEYKAYKVRDLKTITDSVLVKYVTNSSNQVVAAYVSLGRTPTGDGSTRYGLVTAYRGVTKLDNDEYRQYEMWIGDETVTVYVLANGGTLAEKSMYKFDLTSDRQYSTASGSFTELTAGVHGTITVKDVAVDEYNEQDKTLSFFQAMKSENSVYVGKRGDTLSVDDDVKIIYVDADGKKAGDETGINEYNSATGYANAKIVIDDGKIVAILYGSNTEKDVNGTETVMSAPAVGGADDINEDLKEDGAQVTVPNTVTAIDEPITVKNGQSVTYQAPTTTVSAAQNVQGTANFKNVDLNENLTVSGTTTIDGTVDIADGKKISVENGGTVTLKGNATQNASGAIEVKAGGTLVLDTAVTAAPKITGAGTVTVKGTPTVTSGMNGYAASLGGTKVTSAVSASDGETKNEDLDKAALVLNGTGKLSEFASSKTLDDYARGGDGVQVYDIAVSIPDGYTLKGYRQDTGKDTWDAIEGALTTGVANADGDGQPNVDNLVLLESTKVAKIKLVYTKTDDSTKVQTVIYTLK